MDDAGDRAALDVNIQRRHEDPEENPFRWARPSLDDLVELYLGSTFDCNRNSSLIDVRHVDDPTVGRRDNRRVRVNRPFWITGEPPSLIRLVYENDHAQSRQRGDELEPHGFPSVLFVLVVREEPSEQSPRVPCLRAARKPRTSSNREVGIGVRRARAAARR